MNSTADPDYNGHTIIGISNDDAIIIILIGGQHVFVYLICEHEIRVVVLTIDRPEPSAPLSPIEKTNSMTTVMIMVSCGISSCGE